MSSEKKGSNTGCFQRVTYCQYQILNFLWAIIRLCKENRFFLTYIATFVKKIRKSLHPTLNPSPIWGEQGRDKNLSNENQYCQCSMATGDSTP